MRCETCGKFISSYLSHQCLSIDEKRLKECSICKNFFFKSCPKQRTCSPKCSKIDSIWRKGVSKTWFKKGQKPKNALSDLNVKWSKKQLENLYENEKLGIFKIAELLGTTKSIIWNYFKYYNIKTRTYSESLKFRKIRYTEKKRLSDLQNVRKLQEVWKIPEKKQQIIAKLKNIKHREEWNLKVSIALKGKPNPKLSIALKELYRKFPEKHICRRMSKNQKYGVGYVSKNQWKLFQLIKPYFGDAELNFPVSTKEHTYFLDIGIPSLKIDVEYDGEYWHKERLLYDKIRDEDLRNNGWKIIRVSEKKFSSFDISTSLQLSKQI